MIEGQWYPGNMARAVNRLRQDLKIVDLVVELIDARIPGSSRNPLFGRLLEGKKHLLLLHKADLAEETITNRWVSYFNNSGIKSLSFSVNTRRSINHLLNFLKQQEKNIISSRIKRPLRMMIIGIPNVGKSTLINYFVKKSVVRTGNQPGITRGRQWIKVMPGVELLDTPGILWPKLTDRNTFPLAAVGSIPAGRIDVQDIALWLIRQYLENDKASLLLKRYRELLPDTPDKTLEQIGLSQGCLRAEGLVDFERASAFLLRDFQNGSLGRISLEKPPSQ
ncbi:MAG: ribosome biogenesis GTPase YlqF [Bacillota bacterium]|nr:ribosome biogenesis GTPase YlqF [Bacillota bacterium]